MDGSGAVPVIGGISAAVAADPNDATGGIVGDEAADASGVVGIVHGAGVFPDDSPR